MEGWWETLIQGSALSQYPEVGTDSCSSELSGAFQDTLWMLWVSSQQHGRLCAAHLEWHSSHPDPGAGSFWEWLMFDLHDGAPEPFS